MTVVTPLPTDRVAQVADATPRALRIHFLLGGLGIGGAERQAIALAAGLRAAGQDVAIISLEDGPLRGAVEAHGVPLFIMPRPIAFSPSALPALRAHLQDTAPDVVYAFLEVQWLMAAAAARGLDGTTVVFGLRTSNYRRPPAGLKNRAVFELARRAGRGAALLIANSASGLTDFRSVSDSAAPGTVVPNGIDASQFAPLPCAAQALRAAWGLAADTTVIGHVGRLDPVKDHESLIHALALLAMPGSDVHLVCVGEGPAERVRELRACAAHHGVADRVHFVGSRDDLAAVYSAFDVLALPSKREGFPNVVAEAMACGVPAVVTDTGAAPDIVGELGAIVPVGDTEALAAALQRVLGQRSLAGHAACRNRILANFTLDRCVTRTLDAFRSLVLRSDQ